MMKKGVNFNSNNVTSSIDFENVLTLNSPIVFTQVVEISTTLNIINYYTIIKTHRLTLY